MERYGRGGPFLMAKRDIDPKQVFIGKKIKYMRQLFQMKLEDLAAKTNLTASHISKLERAVSLPSISALIKLSQVFNIPVANFLEEGDTSLTNHRKKGSRHTIKSENGRLKIELLTDVFNGNPRTEVALVNLANGAGFTDKHIHKGEEVIYVQKGKVEVELGSESYILNQGDSIDYSSTVPHRVRNADSTEAVIITCVTPPYVRTDIN
jgi:quercetin dioxygenase-like cupin family protein/DNA-binding XRE family transcriptional regulator